MRSARGMGMVGMAAVALALLSGCAATTLVPIDHAGFQPEPDERALWDSAETLDKAMAEHQLIDDDPALQAYLDGVVARLTPPLGGDLPVRVRVLRDPYLNAFAMPNGSVYLHAGLLARIDNEAQLATVLGHELVHFTERHSLKTQRTAENRRAVMQVVFGVLAAAAAGASGDLNAARLMMDLGDAISPTVVDAQVNGYSRDLEREADARGFALVAAAGYDVAESPKVFAHLQQDHAEADIEEPYFFGSHPRLAERIESYQALLAARPAAPGPAPRVGRDELAAALSPLLLDNARADIRMGRTSRALRAIDRHLAHTPANGRAHFLRGEALRRAGDADAARLAYDRAVDLDPGDAAAARELGLLHRAAGRHQAARAAFARYLELAPAATDRPIIEVYVREAEQGGAP